MTLKPSDIKPNPNNPRLIRDDKYKKLVQSIKDLPKMANIRPVAIDQNNMILGGNQRYRAMVELGWTEIPVVVLDETWSDDEKREFIIKDNRDFGEDDWDMLANEWDVSDLECWGVDLPGDFGQEEVEEDEAPEVGGGAAVSVLGTVYQLGRHRVMCGNSTKPDDIKSLIDGFDFDTVYTDPPYGLGGYGGRNNMELKGDDLDVLQFYEAIPHAPEMYVWGNYKNLMQHLWDTPRDVIVWVKNNFGLGKGYRGQYELCFYYGGFDGSDSDVWQISKDVKYEHPTQKPLALANRAFKNSNSKNVLDVYLGSGSTLIACEQTDRTCYGMELDPKYVDVIRKRYARFIDPENWEASWQTMTPAI